MLRCSSTSHLPKHTNAATARRTHTSRCRAGIPNPGQDRQRGLGGQSGEGNHGETWKPVEALKQNKKTLHGKHLPKNNVENKSPGVNNQKGNRITGLAQSIKGRYPCKLTSVRSFTPRFTCHLFRTPTGAAVHTRLRSHSHSFFFRALFSFPAAWRSSHVLRMLVWR